jgi:hypothetical protein
MRCRLSCVYAVTSDIFDLPLPFESNWTTDHSITAAKLFLSGILDQLETLQLRYIQDPSNGLSGFSKLRDPASNIKTTVIALLRMRYKEDFEVFRQDIVYTGTATCAAAMNENVDDDSAIDTEHIRSRATEFVSAYFRYIESGNGQAGTVSCSGGCKLMQLLDRLSILAASICNFFEDVFLFLDNEVRTPDILMSMY